MGNLVCCRQPFIMHTCTDSPMYTKQKHGWMTANLQEHLPAIIKPEEKNSGYLQLR